MFFFIESNILFVVESILAVLDVDLFFEGMLQDESIGQHFSGFRILLSPFVR